MAIRKCRVILVTDAKPIGAWPTFKGNGPNFQIGHLIPNPASNPLIIVSECASTRQLISERDAENRDF